MAGENKKTSSSPSYNYPRYNTARVIATPPTQKRTPTYAYVVSNKQDNQKANGLPKKLSQTQIHQPPQLQLLPLDKQVIHNDLQTEQQQDHSSLSLPSHHQKVRRSSFTQTKPKLLKPFNTSEIKILLCENINQTAVTAFKKQGYQVECFAEALSGQQLLDKIKDVHAIGIRSKTKLTKAILKEAKNLMVVGCFCIGTNQVDLDAAGKMGMGDRNIEMHKGVWNKVSNNCYEIRGKTLGIVGYGHIGSQLSVLAEAMGMTVFFYDIVQIMSLGTAKQVDSLEELLSVSDFVSVHVPELEDTKDMIGESEIMGYMKKGSFLINAARGTVVQIPALIKALKSGHLQGAAFDVFPKEPASNGHYFTMYPELLECPNLILTPHIGGSTEEAQSMIGTEVSNSIVKFINQGTSTGAVNYPEIDLRSIKEDESGTVRVLHAHQNVPGVLKEINQILSSHNVEKQYSDSKGDIAYVMADITNVTEEEIASIYNQITSTKANIKTRVLY